MKSKVSMQSLPPPRRGQSQGHHWLWPAAQINVNLRQARSRPGDSASVESSWRTHLMVNGVVTTRDSAQQRQANQCM